MNLNSKYFDRIRIAPERPVVDQASARTCEWHGCHQLGGYRAPKGRLREGQYHNFCLDHVREYNKGYNYFAGMADDDVVAYQRSAATGHRPTWRMGVEKPAAAAQTDFRAWQAAFSGPFGMFADAPEGHRAEAEPRRRPLNNLAMKSFRALDLEGDERGAEIKARYKTLVKLLHPDANGGDRSSEDRLRQIIQAYHYLRSVGYC